VGPWWSGPWSWWAAGRWSAAAAEVGAAVGAGARAGTVVLVVGWRTVLSGVPTLSSPAAATAAVVEVGHGRASQLPGGAGLPKA
jgi:hypothetical protein